LEGEEEGWKQGRAEGGEGGRGLDRKLGQRERKVKEARKGRKKEKEAEDDF